MKLYTSLTLLATCCIGISHGVLVPVDRKGIITASRTKAESVVAPESAIALAAQAPEKKEGDAKDKMINREEVKKDKEGDDKAEDEADDKGDGKKTMVNGGKEWTKDKEGKEKKEPEKETDAKASPDKVGAPAKRKMLNAGKGSKKDKEEADEEAKDEADDDKEWRMRTRNGNEAADEEAKKEDIVKDKQGKDKAHEEAPKSVKGPKVTKVTKEPVPDKEETHQTAIAEKVSDHKSLGEKEKDGSENEPVAQETGDGFDKFGKSVNEKDKTPITTYPEHTWGHDRSSLGSDCEPGGPAEQCGDGGLVCNHGHCQFCKSDNQCPSLNTCFLAMSGENVCVPEAEKAWEKVSTDPMHMLCSLLIFFASVLASAAGTGGGGMFVPLLVLFSVLKAENAVPLSQCMIFCSSFCNLIVFVSQRHTNHPEQPKIDYDCVVLFEPMLCLGVTFGVLLHRMSPQWFLLSLLCITLGFALWRTARKGLKQREEEKCIIGGGSPSPGNATYRDEIADIAQSKSTQITGIIFVWLLMFVASFHGMSPCTAHFGFYIASLTGLLVICTLITIKYVITRPEAPLSPKCSVDWLGKSTDMALAYANFGTFTFPMMAFAGGLLGGLLGLGGGVIMSPVLLEVGMHSESVQATTAMIVFLSSSLATIQFALLSQIVWHYALWYSFIAVVATFLGQRLCEVYVRRTGRYSLITLSIAGVLCFSLVALAYVGTQQVIEDVRYGQQMGWSTAGLCSAGRFPLFDHDADPVVNPLGTRAWTQGGSGI